MRRSPMMAGLLRYLKRALISGVIAVIPGTYFFGLFNRDMSQQLGSGVLFIIALIVTGIMLLLAGCYALALVIEMLRGKYR